MSIDQLKARRRELLARKKYELDLQAKGEGDPLDLFVVEEELLSVNAQLRMLNPQVRVGTYRSSKDFVFDKQQFKEWVLQDQDQDEETQHEFAVQHKAAITEILRSNEVFLTDRQREIISLWEDGESITQIAERLRVNSSTVSRTVSRAVQTLRWISDRKLALQKRGVGTQVDMSDPEISKTILSALTEKQAVDLYLYYAEWLSLREIGEYEKALDLADYLVLVRDEMAEPHALRAIVLEDLGRMEEAKQERAKATSLGGEVPVFYAENQ